MTKPPKGLPKDRDPLKDVARSGAAAKATPADSRRAGPNFRRKTIILPPGQIELIAELAAENQVGIMAMYRWIVDKGLAAYEAGERPVAKVVAHEVELEHPSSGGA